MVEGLDRTGKDTQIKLLQTYFCQNNINPFHVLHYSGFSNCHDYQEVYKYSKKYYSEMFEMIYYLDNIGVNLILNRAHLGEHVYGHLYRAYDGSYIFDLEKIYPILLEKIYLFVFIDDPKNLIKRDDGMSFSTLVEKKQMEIDRFKEAFQLSNIQKKWLVDISDKSIQEIHEFILDKISKE
ncbi:hypothetical protein M0Q97_09260 [Candidatus Dojkabacteria bacterium]|nr:hypothetical protein [Candidatus Dojkabacteria bacterium]